MKLNEISGPVNDGARGALDFSELMALAYRLILGREIEPRMLAIRVEALKAGIPFTDMFVEIATSAEAVRRDGSAASITAEQQDAAALNTVKNDARLELWKTIITTAYKQLLYRTPRPEDIGEWVGNFQNGLSAERFFECIVDSEEAHGIAPGPRLGSTQSDGEFLVGSSGLLFGRGLTPREIVLLQNILNEVPEKREEFAIGLIDAHLKRRQLGVTQDASPYDSSTCQIMGTTRMLTKRDWDERRRELTANSAAIPGSVGRLAFDNHAPFEHTGSYTVSMIASLYKGGRFIRQFLDNITSQSLFDSAELIIVDAGSPENEQEVIKQYQQRFPNIVYKKINYRIGIYEAWNLGVEIARGRYLTNTNLDDLRRSDSIALQAALLDQNDDIDVVYQDFYYSFEPHLTFDEIAACGFKSELPILSAHNLLLFNSPHNAPMWRARLHDELGTFNTRYRSAGDYEFWARCFASGKTFRKINTPHVVYYQNPQGISTRPDTRGIEEAHNILTSYSGKLIAPALLQSRQDFRSGLGSDAADVMLPNDTPYYDVAQNALLRLGASRRFTLAETYNLTDKQPNLLDHID